MLVDERPMASCSILWKFISGTKSFLSQGLYWSLGNQRKILFWDDWWYGDALLADDPMIDYFQVACTMKFVRWVVDYIHNHKWLNLTVVDPSLRILQDWLSFVHSPLFM
ncbi:hypothetical protein SUGI_0872070 [Cryptomeria japonica]|nr:hypothetical protein SUGI_0872070 [Cryptomeria japonica]